MKIFQKKYKFLFLTLFLIPIFSIILLSDNKNAKSPEITFSSKGQVMAASCGFSTAGHSDSDYASCTATISCNGVPISKPGRNLCGGVCTATDSTCPSCTNGAINAPTCNQCPAGANMVSGNCACSGGQTMASQCTSCPTGQAMYSGSCRASCQITNVCGQVTSGFIVNGVCTNGSTGNPNDSCINNFTVTTDNVNPGGSVEFSWKIAQVPGVGSRCGFVDLTTPTPRPIPGLQNLDTTRDRARISNIQVTTRFCLVCQFYNLLDNSVLGEAAVHQWIRVIRIGEN